MGCWECRFLDGGLVQSPRFKSFYLINCGWCVLIPEIQGWRQEGQKLKIIFGALASLRPAWATY